MARDVVVAGVGMTAFAKPGSSDDYLGLGEQAVRSCIEDAGVDYRDIGQAYVGWVYGDSTAGQAALYRVGLTGVPIVNVNNNCSTGSTALYLARQAVQSGAVECALALGFEQMVPGALEVVFKDRTGPLDRFLEVEEGAEGGDKDAPMALRLFGSAGWEYQEKYGASSEAFALVRVKASEHAIHNERAIFRTPLSIEDVQSSPTLYRNLTRLQCCPGTCGGAAAILCTDEFAKRNGLRRDVVIAGQSMTTDTEETFYSGSMMNLVGFQMSKRAAHDACSQAGFDPKDIPVVELHDCFTSNEVITYEALGLCGEGDAERFILDRQNTYGGQTVTNPSGGLLAKGHPLGATGLAQCAEIVWQLRGEAGKRQVENAKIGLQHNVGLGGACVVTAYEKRN